ncbi:MAG: 16S rRNA processing protein RimM [Clostridia bacterium]|nr:16S rRNA processing protein RimM [Clostridia bacterium]
MENTLKIGLITKPHGIKGEMRVTPLTDDPARFKRLKKVIIDGKNYGVSGAIVATDAVYLSLSGITDRNAAESFRGKFLRVDREDAEPLEENTYFIADIIGCKVIAESGKTLCTVTEVISAKTDIFTGETEDGKIVRFPFLRDALLSVDVAAKTITVREKRFGEISLYEN